VNELGPTDVVCDVGKYYESCCSDRCIIINFLRRIENNFFIQLVLV